MRIPMPAFGVRGRSLLRSIVLPVAVAGAGCLIALAAGPRDLADGTAYATLTSVLLAIGLYGSVFGISLAQARQDGTRVVLAVTVGVVVKAALIAAVMLLTFQRREFILLAIAVAQIDPLSVAALLRNTRMSVRARTILAAWASFDDPVTTVLTVYAASAVLGGDALGGTAGGDGVGDYIVGLVPNLLLVAGTYLVWRGLRARPGSPSTGRGRRIHALVAALAVATLLVLAVWWFLMLGLALAALFMRPPWLGKVLDRAVQIALLASALLLGTLLADGVHWAEGVVLGVAAFAAQVPMGLAIGYGLPRRDRVDLMLCQQNGITAIVLALLLQPEVPEAVGTVGPAILVVNVLHHATNLAWDRWTREGERPHGRPPRGPGPSFPSEGGQDRDDDSAHAQRPVEEGEGLGHGRLPERHPGEVAPDVHREGRDVATALPDVLVKQPVEPFLAKVEAVEEPEAHHRNEPREADAPVGLAERQGVDTRGERRRPAFDEE